MFYHITVNTFFMIDLVKKKKNTPHSYARKYSPDDGEDSDNEVYDNDDDGGGLK